MTNNCFHFFYNLHNPKLTNFNGYIFAGRNFSNYISIRMRCAFYYDWACYSFPSLSYLYFRFGFIYCIGHDAIIVSTKRQKVRKNQEEPGFCQLPSISRHSRARICTRHFTGHRHFTRHCTRQLGIVLGNLALYSATRHFTRHTTQQSAFVPGNLCTNYTCTRYQTR